MGLKLNTVVKTFLVLEFLSESNSPHTLTSLTKVLNVSMGTAQRITQTLIDLGYLSKDPENVIVEKLLKMDLFFPKKKLKGVVLDIYKFWESWIIRKHLLQNIKFGKYNNF